MLAQQATRCLGRMAAERLAAPDLLRVEVLSSDSASTRKRKAYAAIEADNAVVDLLALPTADFPDSWPLLSQGLEHSRDNVTPCDACYVALARSARLHVAHRRRSAGTGAGSALSDRTRTRRLAERAQPQAVGDHEHRRQRHRGAGDHRG